MVRRLPPEEWARLAGTPLAPMAVHAGRLPAEIIVVEADGQVVGTLLVGACLHAEGVWVDERWRGRVAVLRGLLRALRAVADQLGVTAVVVGEPDDPDALAQIDRWVGQRGGRWIGRMGLLPVRR